jgi:hypothetical protein
MFSDYRFILKKVVRYQSGHNHKPSIEEQTTQWLKEKTPKGQTMIYTTLHRKLKIEQCEPH